MAGPARPAWRCIGGWLHSLRPSPPSPGPGRRTPPSVAAERSHRSDRPTPAGSECCSRNVARFSIATLSDDGRTVCSPDASTSIAMTASSRANATTESPSLPSAAHQALAQTRRLFLHGVLERGWRTSPGRVVNADRILTPSCRPKTNPLVVVVLVRSLCWCGAGVGARGFGRSRRPGR